MVFMIMKFSIPYSNNFSLVGYTNSDSGGDVEIKKTTDMFFLSQQVVVLSTIEAEYMMVTFAAC